MKQEIKAGSITDKGTVEKIVYLAMSNGVHPTGMYVDKPEPGHRNIACGKIGNKNYPLGELKLIEQF